MRSSRNRLRAPLALAAVVAAVVGVVAFDDPVQWILILAGAIVLGLVGFDLIGYGDDDRRREAPFPPGGGGNI